MTRSVNPSDVCLLQMVSPNSGAHPTSRVPRVSVFLTLDGLYYVADADGTELSSPCSDWRLVLAEAAEIVRARP